jgi:hypothetical protein
VSLLNVWQAAGGELDLSVDWWSKGADCYPIGKEHADKKNLGGGTHGKEKR